jgi:hypothetical protein
MKFTRKRVAVLGGVIAVAAAIAVPAALAATYVGNLQVGDTTQTGRLFRDGIPSKCENGPKTNPGLVADAGVRSRDTRRFWNNSGRAQCVNVRLYHNCGPTDPSNVNAFVQANSVFVPADPSLNYLADAGQSGGGILFPAQRMSFVVGANQQFDVTVATVDADLLVCDNYRLVVNIGSVSLQGASSAEGAVTAARGAAVDHR